MPGVGTVLATLGEAGYRMAVVTSTGHAHAIEILTAARLIGHFEFVTGGDQVPENKPDPVPYLQTAQRLGVDPADCIAFEDSDKVVTSAVRAGCHTVQIPDLRPPDTPLPSAGQTVARSLAEAVQTKRPL